MKKETARHDPVTGDPLTTTEYLSWKIQSFVRSPWFIILFNLITILAMTFGRGELWNYFASWLAIMIEWIVGKYMFGQTGRDAVIIRHLLKIAEHIENMEQSDAPK